MGDRADLLAIGDVHLGTRCTGIPQGVFDLGVAPDELTPAASLERCVDLALDRDVAAVLFAGDVVESTNSRFEAMVPLEACVRRLIEAGVAVIAVAGNHDVEALPRLARLVEGFDLLGAGGTWETRVVSRDRDPLVEIIGWSFGERLVRQSPVAGLLAAPVERSAPDIPCIGLLHADLGASGGTYAPVRQAELDDAGCDAWLLGHIHRPSLEDRRSGYLGSLASLDPTETGPHGPWLVRIGDDGRLAMEQVPLSPVRREHVTLAVDGLAHAEDVADRLLAEAESQQRRIASGGPLPRALGLRVRLVGSSPCHDDIVARIAGGDWRDLVRMVDGTAVFFSAVVADISPLIDLRSIARGDDPAALLARRLIILEDNGEDAGALLEEARMTMKGLASEAHWSPVDEHRSATDPLSDDALREVLLDAGRTALHAMLDTDERERRS